MGLTDLCVPSTDPEKMNFTGLLVLAFPKQAYLDETFSLSDYY
jgi:hypothetical protein